MLSYCRSAALSGIDTYDIDIELDINRGLPGITIVGLPDTAVKESRDRVRSAIVNSGFKFPEKKITINLAPADTKKEGPHFDLPIALGILAAQNEFRADVLTRCTVIGELSLDGSVREVKGILPIAADLLKRKYKRIIVPYKNALEASAVKGLEIYPVKSLKQAVDFLKGEEKIVPADISKNNFTSSQPENENLCFSDVKGQSIAKRALTIATAGGHNILLIGSPGSGKSMLAKRIPSIIPPMSIEESLEVSKIHSVVYGLTNKKHGIVSERPFRSPHHTISNSALIGGGSDPKPGEVSLAHNGVLFLDEFPEFRRDVLEVLREPLEEGNVSISRAAGCFTFPADFMLVAAMNPCPCGYLTDEKKECRCTPMQIQRYRTKISGPLLDRIDIHIEVPAIQYEDFKSGKNEEPSKSIRAKVKSARDIQNERFRNKPFFSNAGMSIKELKEFCQVDKESEQLLKAAFEELNISARAHDRILKVARTIADLEGQDDINVTHIAEAINFRAFDRSYID